MKMKNVKNINQYKSYSSKLNDVAFRVNYNKQTEPYISINGHWFSRPHAMSDVDIFFEYVYSNPNKTITFDDVKKDLKISLKKGLDDIMYDLGFKGDLAKLFFKKITNKEIHFINPVYQKDLKKLNLDFFEISALLHTPKRKGAMTMIR